MVAEGAQKFRFVSPGVEVAEVDNSRLPRVRAGDGPVIIGRTQRGPALRPVTIGSFSEFVEIFGNPNAGGFGGDVWRDGNNLAPTYAAYAAQAWLKNQTTMTFVRLLGTSNRDATIAGEAGWQAGAAHDATYDSGGAFGLFIIDSGTAGSVTTGSLAAIIYCSEGSVELSGALRGSGAAVTGTAVMVESQGTDKEFKLLIKDDTGGIEETVSVNFNINSKKYIRSVLNTNPTLLNDDVTRAAQLKTYFLGETFERHLDRFVTGSSAGGQFGMILSLQSGSIDQNVQRMDTTSAHTGWIIPQDLASDTSSFDPSVLTKLFRFVAHDSGEWEQKNLKISIADITPGNVQTDPYGTFTVQVRMADDNDASPRIVESFANCNLNPNSVNYVARRVGDRYQEWDDTNRRFREFGNHVNNSRYFRVEMNDDVDAGATNPEFLPFGVLGPVRFKGFSVISGASAPQELDFSGDDLDVFAVGNADVVGSKGSVGLFADAGSVAFSGSFLFPEIPLRTTSREGNLASPTEAYFGIDTTRVSSVRFERSYMDMVRKLPDDLDEDADLDVLEYSWIFTLDDLAPQGSAALDRSWAEDNRVNGLSTTALTGTYSSILDDGFDRFTVPVFGGFDGVNIQEKEPFNNRSLSGADQTTSYVFNSLKRAIDASSDPEVVDSNLLVVPGITNTGITDQMLDVAEKRADTLAIIDLEGGFVPSTENTSGDSSAANRGDVATTISNLKARAINSSYGAAYYPWLQVRDEESGALFWCPPSVVMLGVLGSSERKTAPWIPAAGFQRGGLSEGAGGLPVIAVRERLDSKQRDKLYEANINPIAPLPNEGIVVFGQKTLQVTPSALDRINVRRLLIFVKKNISRLASRLLFEQNLDTTWDRFTSQADDFLRSVATRFGLEDYRVILDNSTTTDDLKDRNIMYAKIFLKPAKAIEFIGIDFVITRSGAAFED